MNAALAAGRSPVDAPMRVIVADAVRAAARCARSGEKASSGDERVDQTQPSWASFSSSVMRSTAGRRSDRPRVAFLAFPSFPFLLCVLDFPLSDAAIEPRFGSSIPLGHRKVNLARLAKRFRGSRQRRHRCDDTAVHGGHATSRSLPSPDSAVLARAMPRVVLSRREDAAPDPAPGSMAGGLRREVLDLRSARTAVPARGGLIRRS